MTQTIVTRAMLDQRWEEIDGGDMRVCVYCDNATDSWTCHTCGEYDGLMTIEDWEAYTGETWDD